MEVDITNVLATRLKTMGMSQAQFAEQVSATPAQVSIFFRKQGSLSVDALNKGFDLTGINVSMFDKRIKFASEIASFLKSKGIQNIDNWTKQDLANFTQKKEIKFFFDVKDQDELVAILSSNLIDYESTFPYIKSLISYFLKTENTSLTSSAAKSALTKLIEDSNDKNQSDARNSAINALSKAVAMSAIGLFIGGALNAGLAAKKSIQSGASSLFSRISENSLVAKCLEYLPKGKE